MHKNLHFHLWNEPIDTVRRIVSIFFTPFVSANGPTLIDSILCIVQGRCTASGMGLARLYINYEINFSVHNAKSPSCVTDLHI